MPKFPPESDWNLSDIPTFHRAFPTIDFREDLDRLLGVTANEFASRLKHLALRHIERLVLQLLVPRLQKHLDNVDEAFELRRVSSAAEALAIPFSRLGQEFYGLVKEMKWIVAMDPIKSAPLSETEAPIEVQERKIKQFLRDKFAERLDYLRKFEAREYEAGLSGDDLVGKRNAEIYRLGTAVFDWLNAKEDSHE